MNIQINRFHRALIVGVGILIILLQSISIMLNELELYGVGWILAYVAGIALIVWASAIKMPPRNESLVTGGEQVAVNLLDEPIIHHSLRFALRVIKVFIWLIVVLLVSAVVREYSQPYIPVPICVMLAAIMTYVVFKIAQWCIYGDTPAKRN